MVDLLGMFRRRPVKRRAPGFARSSADIAALGDSMGEMLTSPVRDAPPLARAAPLQKLDLPRSERPRSSPARASGAAPPRPTLPGRRRRGTLLRTSAHIDSGSPNNDSRKSMSWDDKPMR